MRQAAANHSKCIQSGVVVDSAKLETDVDSDVLPRCTLHRPGTVDNCGTTHLCSRQTISRLSLSTVFCQLACQVTRVRTLLLTKTSRTFPGLSRTPMRNFPGPFGSHKCLNIKKKLLWTPGPPFPSLPLQVQPFKSS